MKKIFILSVLFLCSVSLFSDEKLEKPIIGAKDISSSDIEKGKFFIAVDGKGKECSKEHPCSLESLDLRKGFLRNRIKPNDIIFFRGGRYYFTLNGVRRLYLKGGTKGKPVTYESYPNEVAIFDGSRISTDDTKSEIWREGKVHLREDYTILRKLDIENMPQQGIRIFGNHNIIEGCRIHHNHLSGIDVNSLKNGSLDAGGSYNIIRNNYIYSNSDANINHHNYKNGDNADGITVGKGKGNLISHNTVYSNSDDGIDTWKSIDSIVEYNLVYDNGKGKRGNGNGVKLGGAPAGSPLGTGAIARHNISYDNRYIGFNINSGKKVVMKYNTAYSNGGYGYTVARDTVIIKNISFQNAKGDIGWSKGKEQISNSWQLDKNLTSDSFESLDYSSNLFLVPVGNLKEIGAYAIEDDENSTKNIKK
jgi:parallel beta-helix repeat protein